MFVVSCLRFLAVCDYLFIAFGCLLLLFFVVVGVVDGCSSCCNNISLEHMLASHFCVTKAAGANLAGLHPGEKNEDDGNGNTDSDGNNNNNTQ